MVSCSPQDPVRQQSALLAARFAGYQQLRCPRCRQAKTYSLTLIIVFAMFCLAVVKLDIFDFLWRLEIREPCLTTCATINLDEVSQAGGQHTHTHTSREKKRIHETKAAKANKEDPRDAALSPKK